jgi:hypothetical protein
MRFALEPEYAIKGPRWPRSAPIAACYDNLLSGQVRRLRADVGTLPGRSLPFPRWVALGLAARASASAETRTYLASDRTEVWPERAISIGVPVLTQRSSAHYRH